MGGSIEVQQWTLKPKLGGSNTVAVGTRGKTYREGCKFFIVNLQVELQK